ncbi:MAG TPA: hypothetical protein VIJ28_10720 [Chloroflexota bacterium]|jgi:hypothetical protein
MSNLIRQLECLNCSNSRSFVHHTAAGEHSITQAAAATLPRRAVLACGRCGSLSLVAGWDDSFPYRAPETIVLRHRRSGGAAVATAGSASSPRSAGGLGTAPL